MTTKRSRARSKAPALPHRRLFIASCLSLVTAAMVFIIRGDILDPLRLKFAVTNEAIGAAAGLSFLAMAFTIFFSSPLCDAVGMGRLLKLAAVLHIGGVLLTIAAPSMALLSLSMVLVGVAHGLVEGVINPLCATLYPAEKTHKLNVLHAWWPGGFIIGGLLAVGLGALGASWQVKQALILLPAAAYGVMIFGLEFPRTERAASGVSAAVMVKETLRPGFLLLAGCMLLTAATELGPNQWMNSVLTETAGMSGTLVLVYISGLMFVMRFFAGPIAHRISPVGILTAGSLLAAVGLRMLADATTPGAAYLAATIFAAGVCYFWPTMLGVASERYPKGGALAMGLMGTMGMLSIQFVLPIMGRIRDQHDAATAFRNVAWVPVALTVIFGAAMLYFRSVGGYRAIRLPARERA